jgi:hypothetical protein
MESGLCDRAYLMSPSIPAFWKAMTQNDKRTLPLFSNVHPDAVRLNPAML